MSFFDTILQARAHTDPSALGTLVPLHAFMGIEFEVDDGKLRGRMRFRDHLVGNPMVPALHGGATAALLEATAIFQAVWREDLAGLPKVIGGTVDYLRPAAPRDTFAVARVIRAGRRVWTVDAEAWQGDRDRLVASARSHLLIRRAPEAS